MCVRCRTEHTIRSTKGLLEGPTLAKKSKLQRKHARAEAARAFMDEYLIKMGCRACRERERCCLVFHHLDPTQKEFRPADFRKGWHSLETVKAELAKCECLCLNCHTKIHKGSWPLQTAVSAAS